MFRAVSTRRSHRGYEELSDGKDHATSNGGGGSLQAKLSRAASVPARIFSPSRKPTATTPPQLNEPSNLASKQAKKAGKVHPLFSLFDTRRKTKATAKPEFLRYIQYLKEGGFGQELK